MSDLLKFADELKSVLQYLPALLSFEKEAAEHTANVSRLKTDAARMVEAYKAQALADARGELDAVRKNVEAEGRRLLAEAQERLDRVDDEIDAKRTRLQALDAEIQRGEARLEAFHKIRRELVG